METRFPIHVLNRLSLFSFLMVLFFSSNCFSQGENEIFRTAILKGNKIGIVSEQTLIVNSTTSVSFSEIIAVKGNIDSLIKLFGDPIDENLQQDKAVDGTILFETKILAYTGFKLILAKRDYGYQLSRIELDDPISRLSYNGSNISIGQKFEYERFKRKETTTTHNFRISDSNVFKQKSQNEINESSINPEFVRILADPDGKIVSISILMYSI